MRPFTVLGLAFVVAVGGCAETDPYTTGGSWQPTGVTDRNLAVMVQNKGDLLRGRGERGSDGSLAAAAVTALYDGKAKPLPSTTSRSSGGGGGGGGN